MLQFVTSSIRNQMTAVILVAVVSAVLISSVTAAWRQTARQFDARQNEIRGIAAAMATTIAEPVANGQRRQIVATLNAISRIPGVTHASARDMDKRLLFQHGTGIVVRRDATEPAVNGAIGPLSALYLDTFAVDTPIIFGGQTIGTLMLIADISSLRRALMDSLVTSLALGALAGIFGIVAAMFLQKMITDPIIALTRTMQEVRDTGNFAQIAERRRRDETGIMVDTFNDMLAQIRKRDADLLRHRDELEATIEERTRDLNRAKVAAEDANAAKSDFLATMSHEIRTPMNGMLVMAELLSASNLSPRLQRYADVIVQSGSGLLAVINDILDLSKIEAGKLELESIPVEPRRLVDDVLQLFSERAVSSDLEIAGYVAPDVPRQILADPVRLGQVLTNLVNNAMKFTKSGGVMVSIETVGEPNENDPRAALRFSVRDTGIGIPDDKIATIFEAFAQADQSTTREYGGTGIGLSICKRLVGAMDGTLAVESQMGVGSTFSFVVPFQSLELSEAVPATTGVATIETDTIKPVMAAIDLAPGITRDALVAALRDWHITVLPHADARSAAADVQFCDIDTIGPISHEDGVMPPRSNVPIVAIGRFGDTRGDVLLEKGYVERVIDRPLSVKELADLLQMTARDPGSLWRFAEVARTDAPTHIASFAGIRVLAADDSAVNREVLAAVLKRLDVELTSVADGVAAVEAVKKASFDLVFMDGSMPLLDGFAATRQIRAWEADKQLAPIPIVALTAHVVGQKGVEWREAGMTDFVSKPFTLTSIEACLNRWLGEQVEHRPCLLPVEADAAEAGPVGTPLMDPAVLDTIRSIQSAGDNLVARVVGLYIEHAPVALERLVAYGASANPKDIADAAHALKSLSRNVGALRVGDIAGEIESRAMNQDLPTESEHQILALALADTLAALRHLDDMRNAA